MGSRSMRTVRSDRATEWPFVAVDCATVTGMSRGEAIRRARRMRRWSIRQLAEASGVGERTIGRLERGEGNEDTALTIEALERALAPELRRIEEGDALDEADLDQGPGPGLKVATTMELFAELAARYAALEAQIREVGGPIPSDGPRGRIAWPKSGAPSARRPKKPDDEPGDASTSGL